MRRLRCGKARNEVKLQVAEAKTIQFFDGEFLTRAKRSKKDDNEILVVEKSSNSEWIRGGEQLGLTCGFY